MKSSLVRMLLALAVLSLVLSPGWAQGPPVVADAYVTSAAAGTNFGTQATLGVAPTTSNTYIQFDTS